MVDSPKEVAEVEVDSQMEEAEAAVGQVIQYWRLSYGGWLRRLALVV